MTEAPVTVAPAPGDSEEFDAIWERSKASVEEAGNTEGLDLSDRGEAREQLAQRLVKYSGKTYVAAPPPAALVADDTKPRSRRSLVIPTPTEEPVWWDDPLQAEFLDHFILTRRALGNQFEGGLMIAGPAGAGKTQSVAHAIDRLNAAHGTKIKLLKMDCATVTDPQKWFGRREVDKDGTRYERSDFIKSTEAGDVILLDDITRLHPHLHNPVMAFLDGSNAVTLSDLNVTVHRNPQTVYLATANIGVQFGGTHRMDWAMRERFPYTIERGWAPSAIEASILASRTGCDLDGATNLVAIAAKTRAMYEGGDLRSPISTRTLIAAAWQVASGMSEKEALELTALPLFDPDSNGIAGAQSERQTVKGIVEGKFGRG